MSKVVGIDLGTTYSVVAYINDRGLPEIILNDYHKATTPSVVYLGELEPLVGEAAKEKQAEGEPDVASFFKRNMGDPYFVFSCHNHDYTPTELSALVLGHLKKQAEAFFGEPVTTAVITVPAYFANAQRLATLEAGKMAGLQVIKIISEPTAAALAYGLHSRPQTQRILVYDLGGGTFDVSLVEISSSELRVVATDGDHTLGGKDWDERLISYLSEQFEREFSIELPDNYVNELRILAEQLKFTLSARQSSVVRVQAQGQVGTYTVTREQFEQMTDDLMERTRRLTEQVLEASHLRWADLDGVLPVGGSTRMPIVKTYIERISGKPPMGGIHVDEAVALGAAIQAALEVQSSTLTLRVPKKAIDVIAHSLGLVAESSDRAKYLNSILIPKNQEIPSRKMRPYRFLTQQKEDSELEVFLTQGESENPQDCSYLGCYAFTGFPAASRGKEVVLEITYAYNENGTVEVEANEATTGLPLQLTVKSLPSDVPARFLRPPVHLHVRSGKRQSKRLVSHVPLSFDAHGNPEGHAFDLGGGDEDRVSGEKILLYVDYHLTHYDGFKNGNHLQTAVAERNMEMDFRVASQHGNMDLNERLLSEYSQLWYISGSSVTLSQKQVQMLTEYVRSGNGLAIWADNDPYYADANLLAQALIGTRFSGDKRADEIMIPGDQVAPGFFIEHPLTQGVNNLYEGVTICTIAPTDGVTILGQSHDGQLCLGCFEQEDQRIVLDTGFTKLYSDLFHRSAGIARYLCNIAFWLARGTRSVEYKLLTPARKGMATISQGETSESYTFTTEQPTLLTYILQWGGNATLGLVLRDPSGTVVCDENSDDSPLHIELQANTIGSWICQVKGVSVSTPMFPYVLTLVHTR